MQLNRGNVAKVVRTKFDDSGYTEQSFSRYFIFSYLIGICEVEKEIQSYSQQFWTIKLLA